MGPFARVGVFLVRNSFRLREFHYGVDGTRLTLRSLYEPALLLVRPFGSATNRWFAPTAGGIHASDPLHSCQSAIPAALLIPAPLQEFSLPPDQSVQLATRPSGPPSRSARSSFAPRSPAISSVGCGSPFPIRYVSGGLLFLKPLGTFLNMIFPRFLVNRFFVRSSSFQQLLSRVFRAGYRGNPWKACE